MTNSNVGEYTITSFVFSQKGKQLSNRRALYHINERLLGYDAQDLTPYQVAKTPIKITLCPTSICVRKCEFCSSTNRNLHNSKNNIMYSKSIFSEIVEDLNKLNVLGVCIAGGGDPLTYDIDYLLNFLSDSNKSYKIGLHTNGVYLNKVLTNEVIMAKAIEYINISVIAHNSHVYNSVCAADAPQFHQIENNLKLACSLQEKYSEFPIFSVKLLLSRNNYRFVKEMFEYFKNIGISNILLRCVGNFEENQDVELYDHQICELKALLRDELSLPENQINGIVANSLESDSLPKPSRCWIHALQYTAGIDPDGEVYLCAQWSREGYSIGNVNNDKFSDIWNSKQHIKIVNVLSEKLRCGQCNPISCRHYFTNLAIEAYINKLIPSLENDPKKNYGRFI